MVLRFSSRRLCLTVRRFAAAMPGLSHLRRKILMVDFNWLSLFVRLNAVGRLSGYHSG
jgi:hypothetical protein